ncbi:TKL protein kinase [Phytophthora cinnamomi]|uniref:TKL protein kinase n=1 Tax=Phytophthora cinnamomi TaxID=4785 RepID=UPI003559B286|nr:TKL protein kinase [Phytophthora cinnamomi]
MGSSAARLLAAALAVALGPTRAFFFHHPVVHGDSYSYKGDGGAPEHPETLFQPGDVFTDVTLENWDLSDVASLNLPHSIQKLNLVKCKLGAIPEEVRALESLRELNLAENELELFGGAFAASTTITKLNASHNALNAYNVSFPVLAMLDLSANSLTDFPNSVFASPQLDSFRIASNGFEIAAMSAAQYDFFAGLSDFQAGFADVSSCSTGSLVYLQGKGVCRLDIAAAEDPAIVMRDHGADKAQEPATPMATG